VPASPLESWFAARADDLMKRLSDEENRGIWRGSEDGSKLLQTLRDAVRDAVDVASDCGVYEALSYLAEEYLSAMMLPEIQSDELCRQAADWVQNMFVLSGLFHDLREGLGDQYDPDEVDGSGFAVQRASRKLVNVEALLGGLLGKHQEEDEFKCILFMKTRRGVKCALEYLEGTWCGDSYGGSDRERVQKATRPRKLLGKNTRVVSETLKTQTETVQLFQ